MTLMGSQFFLVISPLWYIHQYVGSCIIMMVQTSVWWYIHHYDGTDISMMVHTSEWWYIHQYVVTYIHEYDGTYIRMMVHTSEWGYIHQYDGSYIIIMVHTSEWWYIHQYVVTYIHEYDGTYIRMMVHTSICIYLHTWHCFDCCYVRVILIWWCNSYASFYWNKMEEFFCWRTKSKREQIPQWGKGILCSLKTYINVYMDIHKRIYGYT